jgi:hypothetical protein
MNTVLKQLAVDLKEAVQNLQEASYTYGTMILISDIKKQGQSLFDAKVKVDRLLMQLEDYANS